MSRLRSTRTDWVFGKLDLAFWTYILLCADEKFYSGHTDDLERRIAEHQNGSFCNFTRSRRPVKLVWSETFATREEALAAELIVKKWSKAKKQALIEGDWGKLSFFAKPPRERLSTSLETNGEFGNQETVRVERSRDTGNKRGKPTPSPSHRQEGGL